MIGLSMIALMIMVKIFFQVGSLLLEQARLEEIRDKRLNINPLGFQTNNTPQEKQTSNFLKKDLIEYGMPEEFVGREDTII